MTDDTPILPAHIADTFQAIAKLHADHRADQSPALRRGSGEREPADRIDEPLDLLRPTGYAPGPGKFDQRS